MGAQGAANLTSAQPGASGKYGAQRQPDKPRSAHCGLGLSGRTGGLQAAAADWRRRRRAGKAALQGSSLVHAVAQDALYPLHGARAALLHHIWLRGFKAPQPGTAAGMLRTNAQALALTLPGRSQGKGTRATNWAAGERKPR